MSRARHKAHKAEGGSVKPVWNAGEGQMAAKEAEEKKHGGKVHAHGEGEHSKHRADRPKRARGGRLESVTEAKHHSMHHEKPHRASGGRVRGEGIGADRKPLSSAATVKHVEKGELPEHGVPSD